MWTPSEEQVDDYLDRIGAARPARVDDRSLAGLQLAHLLAVPFENLDIHLGTPIALDPMAIHDKVVDRRRGGYCYELNSSFGSLLYALGFDVTFVSARVAGDDGSLGPEFDHLALLVAAPGQRDRSLVDVGFGDASTQPIPLADGEVRTDRDRSVRVVADGSVGWTYEEDRGEGWRPGYAFTIEQRALVDFEEMNHQQQFASDSHFRKQAVASLLTTTGRVTVSGTRLIVADGGDRTERELSPADVDRELYRRFGLDVRFADRGV